MPRIPLLSPESDLSAEQRRVLDGILGRRGGKIPGPYRFSLHCPELTETWHPLGELLRLKSSFPLRLSELAILIAARAWDCDYVFQAHAKHAAEGGLAQSVIDALARDERPSFEKEDEEALYDYCTELFERHAISDESYDRAKALFGVPGVVELTALIGYYGMVAMTILAHEMPLPAGIAPPLRKRT
jgi:4-carboxymuconolactone decarboxylase